jgi:hypothetical protein
MGKLEKLKKKQVHQRDITAATFEVNETNFIIEGVIKDKSLETIYKLTGEKSPPSAVYHHMIIRWLVKCPDLKIIDLEVEMPTVPVDECHKTKEMLKDIIGVKISTSFTRNIGSLFGGIKGCAHMKSLLLLMGTTAVQGYWCMITRDKQKMEQSVGKLIGAIKNTCYVWRHDGEVFNTYGKARSK